MSGRIENFRKTRILDAAERAFADSGFAGASLRCIVQDAGVNLATVYYYFESKKGLMQAVFKRRFGPMRQEQLELLRRYEAGAPSRELPDRRTVRCNRRTVRELALECRFSRVV